MSLLLQPWFLILFAVVGVFVFYTLGTRAGFKGKVAMPRLTCWVMVGICMVIVTLGVLKVLRDHNSSPFQSRTVVEPVSAR